jgi:hypothetical protein
MTAASDHGIVRFDRGGVEVRRKDTVDPTLVVLDQPLGEGEPVLEAPGRGDRRRQVDPRRSGARMRSTLDTY